MSILERVSKISLKIDHLVLLVSFGSPKVCLARDDLLARSYKAQTRQQERGGPDGRCASCKGPADPMLLFGRLGSWLTPLKGFLGRQFVFPRHGCSPCDAETRRTDTRLSFVPGFGLLKMRKSYMNECLKFSHDCVYRFI